jgi:hypothetical protein
MSGKTHKRRQILVDGELQIGMSVHLVGWLYFYVVSFALLANAGSLWSVISEPETEAAYDEAVRHMQWFTQFTVMPLALTFVCVAAHSLVFTHRIAGPIYRIRTVLRDMAQRKLPTRPVTLREKDYFKPVADELTKVIECVRDDSARQRRMNQETMTGLRDLVSALDGGKLSAQEVLALANQTLDRAERLDRHLAQVDVGGAAAAPSEPSAAPLAPASA